MYPITAASHTEHLEVGDGHSLYIQQSGNLEGVPVVYLHGGPGGGCSDWFRQFFDPDKFESYRQLGYFLGTSAIRDIRDHMLNREVEMDSEVRSSLTLASCLVSHHDSQFAPSSLLETYFEQLRETKGRNRQRILVSQLQNLDLDHSSAITLFEFWK